MESLYEFKGERTVKMIKSTTLAHFFKRPHLYVLTAAFLTLLSYIFLSKVEYSFDDLIKLAASITVAIISIFIITALWCLFIFFLIRKTIKLTVERDRETAQGQSVICHTAFFDDRIELQADRSGKISETVIKYDQIKNVRKNKNFVFVYTKASQFVAVENTTITKGDFDTFYEFLKNSIKAK